MGLTVLLAEDEDDIAENYTIALKELGHLVHRTKNGLECINAYRYVMSRRQDLTKPPFDAVVIDYSMPVKDGVALAHEILDEFPEQRIIFVTGHGPKLLSRLSEFEDKVEVLTKPVPLSLLMAKIEGKSTKEISERLKTGLKKWDG